MPDAPTPTNLVGSGLAEYDKVRRGLRITQKGVQTLPPDAGLPKT